MNSGSPSSSSREECLLVYMTLPAQADAHAFCHALVEKHLAAGMNIIAGAQSIYVWQDEIRDAREWIIFAQVAREAFDDFQNAALAMHPYVVPCVIAADIARGNPGFLEWINSHSRKRTS